MRPNRQTHILTAYLLALPLLVSWASPTQGQAADEPFLRDMQTVALGRMVMQMPAGMELAPSVDPIAFVDYGDDKTVEITVVSTAASPEDLQRAVDVDRGKANGDVNGTTDAADAAKPASAPAAQKNDGIHPTAPASVAIEYQRFNDHMIYAGYDAPALGIKNQVAILQIYLLVGRTFLRLKTATLDLHYDDGIKRPPAEPTPQVKARLFRLASKIRPIAPAAQAAHAETGFALGSVIVGDDGWSAEGFNMQWRLQGHDDVYFGVRSDTLSWGVDPSRHWPTPPTVVLRQDNVMLAGAPALERLVTLEHAGHLYFNFQIERHAEDTPPTFARPQLFYIEMATGDARAQSPHPPIAVAPTLAPKEAVGLWDAMIASIRLRPDAIPTADAR